MKTAMSSTVASNVVGEQDSAAVRVTNTGDDKNLDLEWAEGFIKANTKKVTVAFHPTMIGLSVPFT